MTRKVHTVGVLLIIIAAVLVSDAAWAVTANPLPIKAMQPDGTEITVRLRGDERYNWIEDLDGYLVKKQSDGFYVYAKVENNIVVPTEWKVGQVDPLTVGLRKGVRPPRSLPPMLSTTPVLSVPPGSDDPLVAPALPAPPKRIAPPISGDIPNLVILCQFSDHDNTDEETYTLAPTDYEVLFNNDGPDFFLAPTGSVKDYFTETSYDTVTVNSLIVGWLELPGDQERYTGGAYGFGFYPDNAQGMVEDALNELEDLFADGTINVVDPNLDGYVNLDSDGDGFIDAIDFIHSGYGAEFDGDLDKIWSHMWALNTPWVSESTGLMVQEYHTEPALYGNEFYTAFFGAEITHIGVICHETGHFFGLPDLYDTDGSSSGIGEWGLMGNSWGFTGDQLYPAHPCAWSKIFLGWVNPSIISQGGWYTAQDVERTSLVYRIERNFPLDEYLLIENRQPFGFDSFIGYSFYNPPQGGLAIWHIDDAVGDFNLNNVNDNEGYPGQPGWPYNGNHYRVALLQADGYYDLEHNWGGDAWDLYYAPNADAIGPVTIPNTDTYQNGIVTPTGNSIFWISEADIAPMKFFCWGPKDGRVLNYTKGIEYKTIQKAINNADNGDELIANSDDYYPEHIDFLGKNVILRSGNVDNPTDQTVSPETTLIIGNGYDSSVVTFQYGESPECVLKGFSIINGYADNGGGIECAYASPTISDCIIEGNRARSYGGGIDLWNSQAVVTDCIIRDNEAWSGGGINIDSDSARIQSCQITGNTSTEVGAGISCYYTSATITNCAIVENYAVDAGGAFYLWACDGRIENCTILDNSGIYELGGIFRDTDAPAQPTIINSILWNNGDELFGCSATHSCIEDNDAGTGNIHEDPLLIGPYYLSFNGGYNVGQDADSPCINTGFGNTDQLEDNLAAGLEFRELTTRTDHQRDDDPVDMGYHHYVGPVPEYTLTTTAINGTIEPDVTSQPYDQYTIVHLEATSTLSPDILKSLTWSDTDDDTITETSNTATMDRNRNVVAEFQYVPKYELTVTIIGTNGTAEISDPDNLENTIPVLRARYYEGAIVKIVAVPDEGYKVKEWTGTNDDNSVAFTNTVTMDTNKTVTIQYDSIRPMLYTTVSTDNGTIWVTLRDGTETSVSPTQHILGTVVALRAAPDDPEERVKWTGTDDDAITGFYNTVTMTESKEVYAKFYTPRILHVGAESEYTDIQRAIDDADDDDIVVIHPGEWWTNTPGNGWVIEGKAITLTSTEPDNPTVVAQTILRNRIQIEDVGPDTIINGLTILEVHYFGADGIDGPETGMDGSNGSETFGAGLRIGYYNRMARQYPGFPELPASPTVLNCVFQGCSNIGGNGGNGAGGSAEVPGGDGGWGGRAGGGAIFVGPLCNPIFKNCQFLDNFVDGGNGGNGGDAAPDNFGGVGGSWDNTPPWSGWSFGPYEPYWKYSGYGGAVFCDVNSAAIFEDCVFSGNHSEGGLSGVNGEFMRYDIGPDQVYNIENFGGAIYCEANSNVLFKGCTITDNYADTSVEPFNDDQYVSYGGAVAFGEGANIRFEDCLFQNNEACVGGSLYWEGAYATIADCNVVSSFAYQGGGAYFVNSETDISRCIFEENEATFDFAQGGGVFCFDSNSVFVDCLINDNLATGSGGGLYLGKNDSVEIRNCLITNNSAGVSGGGITSSWYSNTDIVNTTIADNIAERILPTQEEVIGGGILCSFSSSVNIIDSIIWGNDSDVAGPQIALSGTDPYNPLPATLKISYSDIQGGEGEIFIDVGQNDPIWLDGNITEDPLFETGLLGDYYISQVQAGQSVDSPCVDTGSRDVRTAGMDTYLTRTDHQLDRNVVDMGFHRRFAVAPDMCRVADMERDGIIDLPDLLILAEYWLSLGCDEDDGSDFGWCHAADIDKSQSVDFYDYAFLTYCWKIEDATPPQPDPMEWKDPPYPDGVGSISMTAKTATDAWWVEIEEDDEFIEYYFECSDPDFSSVDWVDEPQYTAAGLVNGQQYSFRVKARDGRRREGPQDENHTDFSEWASATAGAEAIPPEPNPSLWATLEHDGINGIPEASGPDSIKMAAYTATDPSGPVQYYFRYTEPDGVTPGQGDGHDSGWQLSNIYEDIGLTAGQFYTYVVRTRDAWGNETQESTPVIVLLADWDILPPTPDPPMWSVFPVRYQHPSGWWHYMAVQAATDVSGVEYFFECTDDSHYSSGWQAVGGVDPDGLPALPNEYWRYVGGENVAFSYRVQVRDLSPNQNETGWSTTEKTPWP